jgi:hypothetical protein
MCAEESTVLEAVAVDFFFNCWYLEIPRCVHYHAGSFRLRISMFEEEAVPQSCIPYVHIGLSIVLYTSSLLLVESFYLCPINILLMVIHNCFVLRKCVCAARETSHLLVGGVAHCSYRPGGPYCEVIVLQ